MGKYVLLGNCGLPTFSDKSFSIVFDEAKRLGIEIPTIVFIPDDDVICLY